MMFFIATRTLRLSNNILIEKGDRVPDEVPRHLCARYEKLDFMKKVFDTVDEPDFIALKEKELGKDFETKMEVVEEYKQGKEMGGKKGFGIKKLADKYGLSQHETTKILKKEGLV